jgi:hypothetical protein
VDAPLLHQRSDAEHPEEIQAEEDDQRPADAFEPHLVGIQDAAESRRGSPQGQEDDREAAHEQERVGKGGTAVIAHLLQRHPGDEREIAGDERKHAR